MVRVTHLLNHCIHLDLTNCSEVATKTPQSNLSAELLMHLSLVRLCSDVGMVVGSLALQHLQAELAGC